MAKAKELQQRYEKSVEIVQQSDIQIKILNERMRKLEEENARLKEDLVSKQSQLEVFKKENQEKIDTAIEEYRLQSNDDRQKYVVELEAVASERDSLKKEIDKLKLEVSNFDHKLESEAEERKIHERKGLQIVKELKRQLALEKSRTETLQNRLESLLSEPPAVASTISDIENCSRLSTSSSTNGNGSSNENGSRTNQDANSVGSWSFVPLKTAVKVSNPALNETLSLGSIDSEDRETVQQPCDTVSQGSSNVQRFMSSTGSGTSGHNSANAVAATTTANSYDTNNSPLRQQLSSSYSLYSHNASDALLIEEQAALVERLTKLQHDNWMLEEKLSYMEQANSSLTEDLANKSDIIRQYFLNQAVKSSNSNDTNQAYLANTFSGGSGSNTNTSRRTSFPNNVNHLLLEKPSLKRVVDFLKERSHSSSESDNVSREATKKMQLMLEETLIKCLKLQENLDYVTSELNKSKS